MEQRDTLVLYDGTEVTVNAKWLHAMCRQMTRTQQEGMSDEMSMAILSEAFANVRASGIKSRDKIVALNIFQLGVLQDKIRQTETSIGHSVRIIVRLQEYSMHSDEDQYEILCNGEGFAVYSSFADADTIIDALIMCMSMAPLIAVNTSAGQIIAEKLTDPVAPGLSMAFIPYGYGCQIDLALAECKEEEELRDEGASEVDLDLYVFEDLSQEGWTKHVCYQRTEVEEVLDDDD